MKKLVVITLLALVLTVALVLGIVTLSKYISTLHDDSTTISLSPFYFRSNLLTDAEEPAPLTVNGKATEFLLANGADSTHYTKEDLTYTLAYYALLDGEWVEATHLAASATLAGGSYKTAAVSVAPIEYSKDGESVICYDVMVVATATAPQKRTLSAKFSFNYTPNELHFSYDVALGTVLVTFSTNDDGGEYRLSWVAGLLPDNADPSGVLRDGMAGPYSLTATLSERTTYEWYFFVAPEYFPGIMNATPEQIEALLLTAITCEYLG